LNFELDLHTVKMNHQIKYLSHGSFRSKVIVRTAHTHHTHTHTGLTALPGPLKWLATMSNAKQRRYEISSFSACLCVGGFLIILWTDFHEIVGRVLPGA